MLGFLQPDSGPASINSIDIPSNYNVARKFIGYISENVSLYPYLTGLENLDYFCKLSGKILSQSRLSELLNECCLEIEVHQNLT